MHRFVWDLRYSRPASLAYEYSIAAVWMRDTPLEPRGPLVLPGAYTVELSADGRTLTQPLDVRLDPRVDVDPDALRRQLALAREIAAALGEAVAAHGEITKLLAERGGALPAATREALTAIAERGQPNLKAAAGVLANLATAVQGADAAPTQGQQAVLEEYRKQVDGLVARWHQLQAETAGR